MDIDNDYDSDGNNIVPCPICRDRFCPSKEGGKCSQEDEYKRDMDTEIENVIEAFKKEYLSSGSECTWEGYPLATDVLDWLRLTLTAQQSKHTAETESLVLEILETLVHRSLIDTGPDGIHEYDLGNIKVRGIIKEVAQKHGLSLTN